MKENRLKDIAEQIKGLQGAFNELPKIMEEALGKMSEEERNLANEFKTEATRIAKGKGNLAEKMIRLQELRKQYGERNNNK